MIRDTAERVMLAVGTTALALSVLHFVLQLLLSDRMSTDPGWLGCVGAVLLVSELGYRWMRKHDVAEQRRRKRASRGTWPATAQRDV